MDERCSRCQQLVQIGDGGRRPPWCPHCGADYVPAPAIPPELQSLTLATGRGVSGGGLRSESGGLKLVLLVGGVMLALAGFKLFDEWMSWDPDKSFREMHQTNLRYARERAPASIEFRRGDQSVTVTDPAEILLFLDLLSNAKQIRAHHSHSVNEVSFMCLALPDVYDIGQDSSHQGEYWLEVHQPGPPKTRRVVQFTSPELTEWLRRTKVAALQE